MLNLRKFISTVTLVGLLFVQVLPVSAQEAPPPPPPPEAPPPPPPPPPPPDSPPPPPNEDEPEPTSTPSEPTDTPAPTSAPESASEPTTPTSTPESSPSPTSSPDSSDTGGQNQDGQSGDATIATGDSTNSGTVVTVANDNLAADPAGSGDGVTVVNSGNGVASDNDASVAVSADSTSVQDNTADVNNVLELGSTTGDNSASYNTGGNNTITTGDANVSGTSITAVNTNVDGVMVSEFNIADDHVGDYVLDFAANCIAGCTPGSLTAKNTDNGADSENNLDVDLNTTDNTFQTNDASVGNTMVLAADSGRNDTDANTNGNNFIATGDANVSASALTFANNNFAGNVVYGVVNIYGDLVGDIVFPEELLSSCCGTGPVAVSNTGNGADSTNTADVDLATSDNTFQTNDANIENVLVLDAQTGVNDADANTGGASVIATGDSNTTAQVLNVANSNITGGNMWLVLVNEAGRWVGRILGGNGTNNFAASAETEFVVDPSGAITVSNAGNGANSTNTADVDVSTDSTTVQTNTANVQNKLDLSANTGANSSSYNTGGSSYIQTGDANIVANIVNFVNNNITGGGQLFVTVVNVFGSWMGDFVTPGSHKDTASSTPPQSPATSAIGGATVESSSASPQSPSPALPTPLDVSTSNATHIPSRMLAGISLAGSSSGGNSPTQVAGFITDVSDLQDSLLGSSARKVIRINLAWFLLLLPAAGILWVVRRRLAHA